MSEMNLMESILETNVPYGKACMWWMGQMGLIVKIGKNILCIDYYAKPEARRQTPPPIPAENVCGITAFLGTHDHMDHIDHDSWKIWAANCKDACFVFPEAHAETVLSDGINRQRQIGMDDGESHSFGDITIHADAAAHEFLARDKHTGKYPCLQYVIEGNGIRLYHAGDTLRYDGMRERISRFGHLNAALLPINGRDAGRYARNCIGNMTFQEAVDLAGELHPDLVMPGHWDMFANNSEDPTRFSDYLNVKYGNVSCIIPKCGHPVWLETNN